VTERYEIRISGRLGPALCAAFEAMHCEVAPTQTTIRARLSAAELRELFGRMDKLGIQLVDLYER
jgi:hypothetical protein